jgi:peptidoglycan/xylan/chitin deacetylase (PgdA/CDA1 family)
MLILAVVIVGVILLAHTAPAPFFLDTLAGSRAVWHMPRRNPPTVYLTFDDGPNPTTTPDLLDVLEREGAHATFFVIDRNITDQTAPILQRMVAGGHAIALHSHTRRYMIMSPGELARTLTAAANHIGRITGRAPCAAFRPHAGWRSATMYAGLRRIDHKLIGFGWMLWDWNWFRRRTADSIVKRVGARISAGDIVVMHDGDESHPFADQRQTVEATAVLVPALRARGFRFGTICAP